jgi:hypothetical protein
MGKKLTEKEQREKEVKKVLSKIKKLEKFHEEDIVKSACYKYNMAIVDRRNAEADIREAEQRLDNANRRLR